MQLIKAIPLVCLSAFFNATPISAQSPAPQASASTASMSDAVARVRAAPGDPQVSFRLAQIATQHGDFRTAIVALERILLLYPSLDNIRLELGVLYLRTGQTVLAERFISDALKSPGVPKEVRTRAQELLSAATQSNRRLRFAGSFNTGVISETNANYGAVSGTLVGQQPIDVAGVGRADTSAFGVLSGQLRYDLGLQAGHLLALDASLYGRAYDEQTELNLTRTSLAPGFDINLARVFGRPADLILRYEFSSLGRGGEDYLREEGLIATLRATVNAKSRLDFTLYRFDQDFIPTTDVLANNERDGHRAGLSFGYTVLFEGAASGFVGIEYANKAAAMAYEAYEDLGLVLGYSKSFEAPIGSSGPWRVDLVLRAGTRQYEGPDPVLAVPDPALRQRDERLSATFDLTVPVSDTAALQFEVGYITQDSTYAVKEYDNTFVSLGFTTQF